MIETNKEYEVLVKEKVQALGETVDYPISQGSEGICPNCGHFPESVR